VNDPATLAVHLRQPLGSALVTTHENPDGDALGSMLAMAMLLRNLGWGPVWCANQDPVPHIYEWLPESETVLGPEALKQALNEFAGDIGAVVVLDVAQFSRLGTIGDIARAKSPEAPWWVVDHHLEDTPCGSVNWMDTSFAAVGEMVAELYGTMNHPLCAESATCLYTAQIADTNAFRFRNTKPRSHRIAARLLDAGVDGATIVSRVLDYMSLPKLELMRRMLARFTFEAQGRLVWASITHNDMLETNSLPDDLDNLVNFGRNIQGVQISLLFKETDKGHVKASLRAKGGFKAADALKTFGGGGHAGAAGVTMSMSLKEAEKVLVEHLLKLLGEPHEGNFAG
jgi:phosphoesterase RecJ-like protein